MGFFEKLKSGLSKTKSNIDEKLNEAFSTFRKVDEDLLEELEEILIMSDVGMDTSLEIIDSLRKKIKLENLKDVEDVKEALRELIQKILDKQSSALNLNTKPSVILVIGVNGVGKTTSIGKIANNLKKQGKKVLMVAADTFRAGAVEQLIEWGNRIGTEVVYKENADPSSVIYDGLEKAVKENYDVVLIDTAGRLQNKVNLMNELAKINKVIKTFIPEAPHETLLVIDATTGQNGVVQAKSFKEITNITGIVLTKLDGTAKGGIVLAIKELVNIPVKFVGLGEKENDMIPFDIEKYIYGLFKEF
jgi:fused signal recognition particle receptor